MAATCVFTHLPPHRTRGRADTSQGLSFLIRKVGTMPSLPHEQSVTRQGHRASSSAPTAAAGLPWVCLGNLHWLRLMKRSAKGTFLAFSLRQGLPMPTWAPWVWEWSRAGQPGHRAAGGPGVPGMGRGGSLSAPTAANPGHGLQTKTCHVPASSRQAPSRKGH